MFKADLLARYCIMIGISGSPGGVSLLSKKPIEPAPLLTLMMRGVDVDFFSSGAKASTTIAGPIQFTSKLVRNCSDRGVPAGDRPTAALLTRTSSLWSQANQR